MQATRRITVALLGLTLVVAGCSAEQETPAAPSGPCDIVANGTPVAKSDGAEDQSAPETATGYRSDMTAVHTQRYAVATANPLATQAACEVLRDGGTAADALVTAQAVLGLVEPQSSGLGGGGFLLYYDAAAGT
ncbi:gamma-glutamyltransferase, partial [Mycobacterium sp. ITM-2017-0098]